ncbi:BppU family phage baseplate upper protein [Mammaliicoccus sciuri]|uniref:BppU family phage baseplate upper protein n=1 Tax=Mammaliicoccus sciuri TaxID=1296 RepID=UPI002DBA41A6|nr:BppU family phage baseplate upper protein [Mammaliicoccus sciuri]MEB5650171.1 BppU family phage baseplate upper protein [Mammaliicoccus sciuri]
MENGINKKGFFDLKVEPHLKPISDLGIGFYNLDENTATLRFQLSNSTGSLLISENNLSVYGYFKSSNGSVSDVIELEIIDELNGIAEITLDQDFLHASTSTKVTGQLYIGVKNVDGRPDYNEVAVLGEFTFEVADALINKVSSFTKIEYIRMFSQLKTKIQKEVADIQEAIKNGADYVAEMQTVKEQGITQINQTVTEGKAYMNNLIQGYVTAIDETLFDFRDYGNQIKSQATSEINNKVQQSVGEIEDVSSSAIEHVDDKLTEFNQAILDNEFIQPETLQQTLDNLQWQKHKITENDGFIRMIDKPNLSRLDDYFTKTEVVYVTAPSNSPHGVGYSGFIKAYFRSGGYGIVEFQPYNSDSIYQNRRTGNTWNGWVEITNKQTDTGWIPFQLINGASSNTAYKDIDDGGFDCAYRTITNGSETKRLLRLNGSNLTHNSVIAQLPSNFCKSAQSFAIRVPTGTTWFGAFIVIRPSGEVRFLINGQYSSWNETGYTYGQFEWTD